MSILIPCFRFTAVIQPFSLSVKDSISCLFQPASSSAPLRSAISLHKGLCIYPKTPSPQCMPYDSILFHHHRLLDSNRVVGRSSSLCDISGTLYQWIFHSIQKSLLHRVMIVTPSAIFSTLTERYFSLKAFPTIVF